MIHYPSFFFWPDHYKERGFPLPADAQSLHIQLASSFVTLSLDNPDLKLSIPNKQKSRSPPPGKEKRRSKTHSLATKPLQVRASVHIIEIYQYSLPLSLHQSFDTSGQKKRWQLKTGESFLLDPAFFLLCSSWLESLVFDSLFCCAGTT